MLKKEDIDRIEKDVREYISYIHTIQYKLLNKDIKVLERYKSRLKPKNIFEYIYLNTFSTSNRVIKLNILEKVLKEKSKSLNL